MKEATKKIIMDCLKEKMVYDAKRYIKKEERAGRYPECGFFEFISEGVVDNDLIELIDYFSKVEIFIDNYYQIHQEVWDEPKALSVEDSERLYVECATKYFEKYLHPKPSVEDPEN